MAKNNHAPSGWLWGSSPLARQARLTLKELREILRDRRTIVTLVLMPLLVYPLLGVAFQKLLLTSFQSLTQNIVVIGVDADPEVSRQTMADLSRELVVWLERGNRLLKSKEEPVSDASGSSPDASIAALRRDPTHTPPQWFGQLDQAVSAGDVDIGVRFILTDTKAPLAVELLYRENSVVSEQALEYVELRLEAVNLEALRRRVAALDSGPVEPAQFKRKSVGDKERRAGFSFATLTPLILILMTITGAVYPAIDLTAGERERNTLESLIAAPVSRLGILLAKFAAVITVALLTATVNTVAMTVTVVATGLGGALFGQSGISLTVFVQVFSMMVLFAAFFSALLLAVTSFARSFKEAQAYLIPIMLLSIAPGLLTLTPGIELSGLLAVTPLANIVLLARDILEGRGNGFITVVVVGSTLFYGLAALAVAARVFGADAVLYGGRGSWSDLFRRPARSQPTATMTQATVCLALIFPAFVILGNLAQRAATGERADTRQPADVQDKSPDESDSAPQVNTSLALVLNSGVLLLVFGGIPLASARANRVRLAAGFGLAPLRLLAWPGALLLGASLWVLVLQMHLLQNQFIGSAMHEGKFDWAKGLVQALEQTPPLVVIVCMGVVPGVVEEFFFRGYFFTALRRRISPWRTILLTALLFGAFHVLVGVLAMERFLPSFLIGLVLGWIRYHAGSVVPCMILHVLHNSLLLLIVLNRNQLEIVSAIEQGDGQLPLLYIAAAAGCAALGAGWIWLTRLRTRLAAS